MNLQYISDSQGETTGVYILINEWNLLKKKYKDLENDLTNDIPQWNKRIVLKRLKDYDQGKVEALDFNEVMNDIEREL